MGLEKIGNNRIISQQMETGFDRKPKYSDSPREKLTSYSKDTRLIKLFVWFFWRLLPKNDEENILWNINLKKYSRRYDKMTMKVEIMNKIVNERIYTRISIGLRIRFHPSNNYM